MTALLWGSFGALLGLIVWRFGEGRQRRRANAELSRDLVLLNALTEDAPHRADVQERVNRRVAADVGRPHRVDAGRAIRAMAVGAVVEAAVVVYVVQDMARTADEESDIAIGMFVVGMVGMILFMTVVTAVVVLLQALRAAVEPPDEQLVTPPPETGS